MKVLQINAVYGSGSTGRTVKELDEYLTLEGCTSLVATPSACKKDNVYVISNTVDRKLHAICSRVTGKQAVYSNFQTNKLLKWIRSEKPDVVHLRNLHANYINVNKLLRFLGEEDIPTVITLHDCWFFTGKCTHYTSAKCDKWQTGCGNCPQLKKDIPSWFFDRTAKMWKDKKELFSAIPRLAVVGVSNWITNEGKKSFLGNAKIIKRIYNWIDLDVFYPRTDNVFAKYGVLEDKFTVLCIGAGWKDGTPRFEDLLALSNRLPKGMQIVLVGNVETEKQLPSNVTAIGYVNSVDELAKLYSQANVYVHLSREDTFGKVIAEAMACGTPAIVYHSTACPELIGENCGYVVETGNLDAVVDALLKVEKDGKAKYSNYCIEFVKENFEKEKLLSETLQLYQSLVKGATECI